jgi:hypothetical protein
VPCKIFISKEEKSISGFKTSKDRLSLLLRDNATGSFKLKTMFIYCEIPRTLKKMRGKIRGNIGGSEFNSGIFEYCTNFCKCQKVPPLSITIKKREKRI